ncbi:MAG: hypothetical protein WAO61_09960 [Solirubrobacterales bacterium]
MTSGSISTSSQRSHFSMRESVMVRHAGVRLGQRCGQRFDLSIAEQACERQTHPVD